MAIGNPITLTSNVASKTISVIATAGQTLFTVTGGYRINQLAVFRNGVRLLDSRDYEARNGATVTLLSAATVGDALEFQVFDDFRVADAIVSAESEQTISGNLIVAGILTATNLSVTDLSLRHLKATGISTVSDTTQSTSTTTGAMIVSGGLGVAKNLFVGGSMSVAGTLTYEDVTNSETAGVTTTGGLVVTGLGATFGSGVGIADSIYHIDDSNTAIRFPAADTFTVETAGSERLRVNSSGQLGIGANNNSDYDTNAQNLLLASSGSTGITIRSGGSSDFALIHFADGTTDNSEKRAGRILYGHSDNFMSFHTANEERLRIIGVGGSIGINETTPDSKVDIVHSTVENSATENLIHLRSDPSGGYVTRGLFVKIGRDGAYDNSAAHYDIVGSSGNSGFHAFEVQGDEKLRITKDGMVGINTTTGFDTSVGLAVRNGASSSDHTMIDIIANTNETSRLVFSDDTDHAQGRLQYNHTGNSLAFYTNGNNERLRITSAGRIGIGTDDPQGLLAIQGDSNGSTTPSIRLQDGTDPRQCAITNSSGDLILFNSGSDNTPHCKITMFDGNIFSFETANTERLRIDSNGNFIFKNGALIENGFHDNGGGLTGNYIHDLATYGNVHFSSTNAAGTFTYNLRITNSVSLNSVMAEGDTLSFTLMHASNNTSYYLTQLKIDGTNVTPVWAGGSAPSAATGSGFDVYSFSIMKVGNNAYGIFGTFTNHA